jgi:hypothetical protein
LPKPELVLHGWLLKPFSFIPRLLYEPEAGLVFSEKASGPNSKPNGQRVNGDLVSIDNPVWATASKDVTSALDAFSLCPLGDFIALLITESANDDHYKVYEGPNPQATSREKLQYPRAYLPHIKPMKTEASEKETKKKCRQDSFTTHCSLLLKKGLKFALDS